MLEKHEEIEFNWVLFRNCLSYSVFEFAKILNIDPDELKDVEVGKKRFNNDTINRIFFVLFDLKSRTEELELDERQIFLVDEYLEKVIANLKEVTPNLINMEMESMQNYLESNDHGVYTKKDKN